MPALVAGIHAFFPAAKQGVDAAALASAASGQRG
jgi:hypothetical protein